MEKEAALFEELPRENVFIFNEEGGGEEDRVGAGGLIQWIKCPTDTHVKVGKSRNPFPVVVQEYDLALLSQVLNNCPIISCTEVLPTGTSPPGYQRPQTNEDLGRFLQDVSECACAISPSLLLCNSILWFLQSLRAVDSDVTAPPYDSVLVFDYEGAESEGSSLSSICSDLDEEQSFQHLEGWGPCFRKLAELYADRTEEDDDAATLPGKTEWV